MPINVYKHLMYKTLYSKLDKELTCPDQHESPSKSS